MNERKGTAIVTLTRPGLQVAGQLAASWPDAVTIFVPAALAAGKGQLPGTPARAGAFLKTIPAPLAPAGNTTSNWQSTCPARVEYYYGSLTPFLGRIFKSYRELILVMAAGIAVRALAPHLVSKKSDPAIVVVDTAGRHAISLLSGHLGGANDLARRVASLTGGRAVITTASEVQGLPPLDLIARDLNMTAWPAPVFNRVMAALINGEKINVLAEPPLLPPLAAALPALEPRSLADTPPGGGDQAGIIVTWRRLALPGPRWVFWRPQVITAGIGCRRGTAAVTILLALGRALAEAGLSRRSLAALATVDFKGEEPGLKMAARRLGLPLNTFTPAELAACIDRKPFLQRSQVVQQLAGIPGVCEPAAILAAGGGELLWPKQTYPGVTVALALAL